MRALLAEATRALTGVEAQREAELLLQHALGIGRAWLYAHADDSVAAEPAAVFRAMVARRAAGEPIAYISGRREFFSLDLQVSRAVLIPRADTELLVELALARIDADKAAEVADLGTGSGAIALALAHARPRASIRATDASETALAQAHANAERLGIGNVSFVSGDWCAALAEQRFDVIVSNPPYIAIGDPHLVEGDLRFEPASALSSGVDGLDAIRTIVRDAPQHLAPGGWLLFEHGSGQGEACRALLRDHGFEAAFTAVDIEGRDRVSGGRRPRSR